MTDKKNELSPAEQAKRDQLRREKPRVWEKIQRFPEKIKKGESVAIIQFQYDYTCNFQCEHCCITKLRKKETERCFTIPDVKEFSRQADEMGLAHWVITGGEPLVFPDLDKLVEAIDPQKFYITSDTNGWFLDDKKAKHLKKIGVDKIQLSLDSLDPKGHDDFRRKKGSHERAVKAIDAALNADLAIILATVMTHQRVHSEEFIQFLEFAQKKGIGTFITYAKPVGDWEGKTDMLVTKEDMDHIRTLEKKYNVFTHLTPSYGHDFGCIACKRMISVTKYGDILPCPYIHTSLGNFFKEPLKDILARGMNIKYFGKHVSTCLIAEDRHFLAEYENKKIAGKKLPVPYREVFTMEDFIDGSKEEK